MTKHMGVRQRTLASRPASPGATGQDAQCVNGNRFDADETHSRHFFLQRAKQMTIGENDA